MDDGSLLVATFFGGYVLQWVRGFRQFGDGATLLTALCGGFIAALMVVDVSAIESKPFIEAFRAFATPTLGNAMTILGGTFVGHVASHSKGPVKLAPKFSELNK